MVRYRRILGVPANIRLYTWVDVEDLFLKIDGNGTWPNWLHSVRAYWDGVNLAIARGKQAEAKKWLLQNFDPRFDQETTSILLESLPNKPRLLPVVFEETIEIVSKPRMIPSFSRPSAIESSRDRVRPPALPGDMPPVVAFHSFKGGVGRTQHALALALAFCQANEKSRVLLVDADLEAPGLTWLLHSRVPNPEIAFADFLALVHGNQDAKSDDSIDLVADRVNELLLDRIYVLPAFRSTDQFNSLEIRPEHIIKGSEDPFCLTSKLAALGRRLKADAVIVDLRAGLSELSAGLLLDPRVYRVIVTTLSAQSFEGTLNLLKILGSLSPPVSETDPLPAIILAQIPETYLKEDLLDPSFAKLAQAAAPFLASEPDQEPPDLPIVTSPFDQNLLVLPQAWSEVVARMRNSILPEKMRSLLSWLPSKPVKTSKGRNAASSQSLKEERARLANFAQKLVYGETGDLGKFLSITPLKHLASDFSSRIPIAVVIGAKGSGKTYIFQQIVNRENWKVFVRDAGVPHASAAAHTCPIMEPISLLPKSKDKALEVIRRTAADLNIAPSGNQSKSQVRDYIRSALREDLHEGEWRERWLNVIAWTLGFKPEDPKAGREFVDYLRREKRSVVAVFDGLEDLFQDLFQSEKEQVALRSLLLELPDWLEQQPERQLGLLVFVRQDMVTHSIKQNASQLMARYLPYALKWNAEEALRLVAWTAVEAKVLGRLSPEKVLVLSEAELVSNLVPLWGRKLGKETSREARSAEWVLAALSDFRGQIQARDLVRLIYEAAKKSQTDTYWTDRLLAPNVIRSVVSICSEQKIAEIGQENRKLKDIFLKLGSCQESQKRTPFAREGVNLTLDEIKTLEENGVILREGEKYHLSEVFRLGLGFKWEAGARPAVLSLSRKARQ